MLTDMARLDPIVVVGSPTALGGHFAGMERTPAELRAHGLLDLLATRLDAAADTILDHGDARNDPGWAPDPDPRMKNRGRLLDYLPRLAGHVADGLGRRRRRGAAARPRRRLHQPRRRPGRDPAGTTGDPARAGVVRRARRLQHAGHDPIGQRLGHAVRDGLRPWRSRTWSPRWTGRPWMRRTPALFGGQVLDETESRMLASSPVAHFGAGMLADDAGRAAVAGWSASVARRIDGWYIAFDLDALDGAEGWAVATPEPDGLALDTAIETIRVIAASGAPIVGFGATAVMAGSGGDLAKTVDAVADLAAAALGSETLAPELAERYSSTRERPAAEILERIDVHALTDRQPALRGAAIDDDGVAAVGDIHQRSRLVPERRRAGIESARHAPVGGFAEPALVQLEPRAARALVEDLEPATPGRPVLAVRDEPARRQDRAVDGPVEGVRGVHEERAVVVVAAAGSRRSRLARWRRLLARGDRGRRGRDLGRGRLGARRRAGFGGEARLDGGLGGRSGDRGRGRRFVANLLLPDTAHDEERREDREKQPRKGPTTGRTGRFRRARSRSRHGREGSTRAGSPSSERTSTRTDVAGSSTPTASVGRERASATA